MKGNEQRKGFFEWMFSSVWFYIAWAGLTIFSFDSEALADPELMMIDLFASVVSGFIIAILFLF